MNDKAFRNVAFGGSAVGLIAANTRLSQTQQMNAQHLNIVIAHSLTRQFVMPPMSSQPGGHGFAHGSTGRV
jgi:hypothetical protein